MYHCTNILLSVIVPSYNSAATLERCLRSTATLVSGSDLLEIIVIDDCSTDSTYDTSLGLAELIQGVRVFRNKHNVGVAASRNKGLRLARGKYVAFLDSDDYFHEPSDLQAISRLHSERVDLVLLSVTNHANRSARWQAVLQNGNSDCTRPLIELVNRSDKVPQECWGYLFRRQFLKDNNLRFPDMWIGEDQVFMSLVFPQVASYSVLPSLCYVHTASVGGLATTFAQRNIDGYEHGWKVINDFQKSWAAAGDVWTFLQFQSLDLAKLLCAYLLIYPADRDCIHNDNLQEIFAWLAENTTLRQSFSSRDFRVNKFLLWLAARIRSRVSDQHANRRFLYCLSCYGAAVHNVFKMSGVQVTAIIDDNRLDDNFLSQVPVLSLERARLTFNNFEYDHFYICHPSSQVFDVIKKKCVESGADGNRVIWIDSFSF